MIRKLIHKTIAHTCADLKAFRTLPETSWSSGSPEEKRQAIREALDWLFRSQDANPDGGCAAHFTMTNKSWVGSYPETTGYIITTLLEALDTIDLSGAERAEIEERATRMADWLPTVQLDSGAFPGGPTDAALEATLFDTGQAMRGLQAIGSRMNRDDWLDAAAKAATWMVEKQNDDGSWTTGIYDRNCRAYYAHAVWPLIDAGEGEAAAKFGRWVLGQRLKNGWIKTASFHTATMPEEWRVLHTMAYTIEGLLEIGMGLDLEDCIEGAVTAARALRERFYKDDLLYAEFDEQFEATARYICVTGCAQMGRVWGRCFEQTGEEAFKDAMISMNAFLRSVQPKDGVREELRGGFPGSIPVYGKYLTNKWPNWATKFALDSFLIESALANPLRGTFVDR